MGRGRGKGKKHIVAAPQDNPGSGEEEKIPSYRRRGRPQKPLTDYMEDDDDDEAVKIEVEDGNVKCCTTIKDLKNQSTTENKRKRKRSSQVKENPLTVKEENGTGNILNGDGLVKSVGFRQIGSRRKSKPHRAAEAGVLCK